MGRCDKCPIYTLYLLSMLSIILSKLPYIEAVQVVHVADGPGVEVHQGRVVRDHDAPRELQTRKTVLLYNRKLGTAPNLKRTDSQNQIVWGHHHTPNSMN